MKAIIKLYAEECNGTAGLLVIVKANKNIILDLFPGKLVQGNHVVELNLEENTIYNFQIYGKNHAVDTVVDHNGELTKDKHIKILGMRLHHINLQENDLHKLGFDPYFGFNNLGKDFFLPPKIEWPQWYLQLRTQ